MLSSSEKEIDLNMGHMLTFLSGHLASCQSPSDLRTIVTCFMQTKLKWWLIKRNNNEIDFLIFLKLTTNWKCYKLTTNIIETNWSIVYLSL